MIDTNKKDSKEYMGKKLRLARTISNLTQEELAEKLSLTPEYVSQIERGISYGSVETLINICKTLNVNADFLLHGLLNNDSNNLSDLIDEDFLSEYLKLDSYNKTLLSIFTHDLIKMQEEKIKRKKQ